MPRMGWPWDGTRDSFYSTSRVISPELVEFPGGFQASDLYVDPWGHSCGWFDGE